MRLSVIIPLYNVEPFVERCLRSLENQDIPPFDYEIICINDGSPDDSRGVVVRMQQEFDNIILIDQVNQGVSRARNNGIDKAVGQYLLFIDPDDYVDADSFAQILENAERQLAQISFLGFTFHNEDGCERKTVIYKEYKNKVYPGIEAYHLARGDGKTDPDRMWAVLYEEKFLNSNFLRYLPDMPYLEDGEFVARILCLAERCVFDGHSFYQRTTRIGSATNSELFHSVKATTGFFLAARNLKRFQQEQSLNENQREFLNQPIAKFVLLTVNSSIGWKERKKLVTTITTLKELGLKRIELEGCKRIYRMYGEAYNLSPYLAALALIFYPRVNSLYQHTLSRKKISAK
jgi:glycosyltransferase involved in cell wall biosynthesis